MLQSSLARQPLVIAGALGLLAGVLAAYQLTAPTALAVEPPPLASDAKPAPTDASGIVFLDSRPAAPEPVAAAPVASAPAEPSSQRAEPPAASTSGSGGFVRMVLMAVFVVGGIVAWYLTRRRQLAKAGYATKSLSLVGTVRIAGRWQVALVKVPGKTLVLGATDKGLSLLSELDDDVAPDVAERERDELAARIRDDETVAFSARAKQDASLSAAPRTPAGRLTTEPGSARPTRSETNPLGFSGPPSPPSDPFGRLLDQLTRDSGASGTGTSPGAARERAKTDEGAALRARLERHQPTN